MTVVATAVQGFEEKYVFYRNIFLYCGIAALVFLAIAIILFFALRIPQVFGELTGRTARKAVEEMVSGQTPTVRKKTAKKTKRKTDTKRPEIEAGQKKQIYSDLIGENDTPVRLVTHDERRRNRDAGQNCGRSRDRSTRNGFFRSGRTGDGCITP